MVRGRAFAMNIALILAGGTGTRLGADIPKQYIEVYGRPVISYCLELFENMSEIDCIWVVAEERWHEFIKSSTGKKVKGFSNPGRNRQLSIWNGLQGISDFASSEDVVVIHDAARPLVTEKLVRDCLRACETHDGALPVLPMKDTVYIGEQGRIVSLLDRQKVFAGQAPEAFLYGKYFEATRELLPEKILNVNGSTEPAILAGMDIAVVEGDEKNFKITTQEDLKRFQMMMG